MRALIARKHALLPYPDGSDPALTLAGLCRAALVLKCSVRLCSAHPEVILTCGSLPAVMVKLIVPATKLSEDPFAITRGLIARV